MWSPFGEASASLLRLRCPRGHGNTATMERKAMPQPTLKTLPFAQPTQCRRYEGRVAIVTGAAQGLGLVIARRLAEEGADVVICDIQEDRLQRAAYELQQSTNRRIFPLAGDLSEAAVA